MSQYGFHSSLGIAGVQHYRNYRRTLPYQLAAALTPPLPEAVVGRRPLMFGKQGPPIRCISRQISFRQDNLVLIVILGQSRKFKISPEVVQEGRNLKRVSLSVIGPWLWGLDFYQCLLISVSRSFPLSGCTDIG